jgi:hypothetical protein
MSEQLRNLPHLNLPNHPNFTERQNYTYPGGGGGKPVPRRDRDGHATQLRSSLDRVFDTLAQDRSTLDPDLVVGESGFYLDVKFSATEKDQVLQSLEDLRSTAKVELMTVTPASGNEDEKYLEATLFVPDKKKDIFEKKIDDYQKKDVVDRKTVDRQSDQAEAGRPKNEALITRIEMFSLGSVISLFADEMTIFPKDSSKDVWWEIWLSKREF